MDQQTPSPLSAKEIIERWLNARTKDVGRHSLLIVEENEGVREGLIEDLRNIVRTHYVAPAVIIKWLEDHGAPKTAMLIREHLPTTKNKKARSGDFGEILATEIAESQMSYRVPIRRLRYKDGRDMALRGDDIVGLAHGPSDKIQFLKGESKSRISLSSSVINEAGDALDRDKGRPSRLSVLFVAERLRENDEDDLAKQLEDALLESFRGYRVEHVLFTLSGNAPENLLSNHLESCANKTYRRHAVGVRINDHSEFIENLFAGC